MKTSDDALAGIGDDLPEIITPAQLAELLQVSVSTIYQWRSTGRLDGVCRRRGKHVLIIRKKALQVIFNGKEWK